MALLKGNATQVSIPVTVIVSRDGADRKIEFTVHYKLRTRAEQLEDAAFIDCEKLAGIERAQARIARARDMLRKVVLGWDGLPGSDESEVAFSPDVLDEMLADDDYYDALLDGLRESTQPGARRKN